MQLNATRPHRTLPSRDEEIAVWAALTVQERKAVLIFVYENYDGHSLRQPSADELAQIRGQHGDDVAQDPTANHVPTVLLQDLGRALFYHPDLMTLPNRLDIIKAENTRTSV